MPGQKGTTIRRFKIREVKKVDDGPFKMPLSDAWRKAMTDYNFASNRESQDVKEVHSDDEDPKSRPLTQPEQE